MVSTVTTEGEEKVGSLRGATRSFWGGRLPARLARTSGFESL